MRARASAHRSAGWNWSSTISVAGTDQNRNVESFVHGLIRLSAEACGSVRALPGDGPRHVSEAGRPGRPGEAGRLGGVGEAGRPEAGGAGRADQVGEPDPAMRRVAERTDVVESAVASMVLYERVIIALRRLAREDASARRFRPAAPRS
jgi:hypothetical protein